MNPTLKHHKANVKIFQSEVPYCILHYIITYAIFQILKLDFRSLTSVVTTTENKPCYSYRAAICNTIKPRNTCLLLQHWMHLHYSYWVANFQNSFLQNLFHIFTDINYWPTITSNNQYQTLFCPVTELLPSPMNLPHHRTFLCEILQHLHQYVRPDVFMAVTTNITVFWDDTV
jgi:hypothetical protein